jgi:hypothetical protein
MKKITHFITLLFLTLLCTQISAQSINAYTFKAVGTNDSGGSGFKTISTNSLLLASNNTTNTEGGSVSSTLFTTSTTAAGTETIVLKADGVHATSFDVNDLRILNYLSPRAAANYTTNTKIVFKNSSGTTIRTMTLNGTKSLSANNTGTSISTFFDNNNSLPVTGVSQIEFTINPESVSVDAFTIKDISLSNVVTGSVPTGPYTFNFNSLSIPSDGILGKAVSFGPLSLTIDSTQENDLIVYRTSTGAGDTGTLYDDNTDVGGIKKWTVSRHGGGEFALSSIYLKDAGFASSLGTMTAFKNGIPVGEPVAVAFNGNKDFSGNLDFQDIDEFRIEADDINFYLDDLVISIPSAADKTPPAFENSTPSQSAVTQTSFTLETDIDEAGIIYYVVVPNGATAPTSAEVKVGTGSGGSSQITSGNAAVSTGGFTNNFTVIGLTAGTAYAVYVVAQDNAGTPNLQASATRLDVTTASRVALTITGLTGDNKVYNGNTEATATGEPVLSGVVGTDNVTLVKNPIYTFATANKGTGIAINTTGYTITGTDASKYTLTQPTLSADITGKGLTITGLTGVNKIYDGITEATATGEPVLSGVVGGDNVTLVKNAVYTFATANKGTGIAVTTTGYAISGTQSGNYTLTQPTLSANITAKALTVTGLTGDNKAYDGTTDATASGTAALSGVVDGENISLAGNPVFSFATANRGTGITVTTLGYAISGTQSGNYSLSQPTLSADITAATLTISGLIGLNKEYDGTTEANASGTAILSGVVDGDDVSLSGVTAYTFATSNAGTGITITTTGYTISGPDASKYDLTQPALTGNITAKPLSITGLIGDTKTYDGTTKATISETAILSGVIGQDKVVLGRTAVYTFATANIGTGITINAIGYTISGDDSTNYSLEQPTLSADIIAKVLTITGLTGDDKTYDGTTEASASGTAVVSGIVDGENISLAGEPIFSFATASRGTGITITTTGYTISGDTSDNYSLTQPTLSADITGATLTITGLTGDNKVYDGTTVGTASGIALLAGVSGDDEITLGGSPAYTFAISKTGTEITITTTGYTISGPDALKYDLTQPSLVGNITAKILTVTGLIGDTKTYDGTTAGTATETAVLSGVVGQDKVVLEGTAVYTFAKANTGTGILINTTGYAISGDDLENYSLTQPTLSADITPKALTITGLTGDDKTYDGTTEASARGTAILSGVVDGENISLAGNPVFAFATANRGTGITINTTAYKISGATSDNYSLMQPAISADITAKALSVTGLTGDDKTYDGNTRATASGVPVLSGFVSSNRATLSGSPIYTFATANTGTEITITTTGYRISQSDAGNYSLTQPTLSADITGVILTVAGLTGENKVYDSTDEASSTGAPTLSGVVGADDVTLAGSPVYTFATKNIGTGITISTTAYTISGADAGKYTLRQPSLSANITAATLTITGLIGNDKTYDGTTDATASGTAALAGVVGDDIVVLDGIPVYTFISAEEGTDIEINTTGYTISSADSDNYSLTQPTLYADITATLSTQDLIGTAVTLKLFPNPSSDYIQVSGLTTEKKYSLYDTFGRELNMGIISKNKKIDIQHLANGMYFINFKDGNTIKFIKK